MPIEDMLEIIRQKNDDFDVGQLITKGENPDVILMIDSIHEKKISPKMREFYTFAIEWKRGLLGFDAVNPNSLRELYSDTEIATNLDIIARNFKPIPPSDISDWERTAILGLEDGGQGLGVCLYWWKSNNDIEPCIISIDGGDMKIFSDLTEYFEYLAYDKFPEKGDTIYTQLEEERCTLRD